MDRKLFTLIFLAAAMSPACKRATQNGANVQSIAFDPSSNEMATGRTGTINFDQSLVQLLATTQSDRQEEPSLNGGGKRWSDRWSQFAAGKLGAPQATLPPGQMGCDLSLYTSADAAYTPDAGAEIAFKTSVSHSTTGPSEHPYWGQAVLTLASNGKGDDGWTVTCASTQGDNATLTLAEIQQAFGGYAKVRFSNAGPETQVNASNQAPAAVSPQ